MYGKLMSISDELMWRYWTFLTDLPQSKIDAMRERVKDGAVHPMDMKKELALTITAGFHGVQAAEHAAQGWSTQFQQKGVAEDLPEVEVSASADGLVADGVVKIAEAADACRARGFCGRGAAKDCGECSLGERREGDGAQHGARGAGRCAGAASGKEGRARPLGGLETMPLRRMTGRDPLGELRIGSLQRCSHSLPAWWM